MKTTRKTGRRMLNRLVCLQQIELAPGLSGPEAGAIFTLTDTPLVTGREYDQWLFVSRTAAEALAVGAPAVWRLD